MERPINFTDLVVWKEGHKLVLLIYEAVRVFPKEEIYGITSQIKRSAISITSNVAEGFGRKSWPDKVRFYYTGRGSLTELHNQLIISKDLKFMSDLVYNNILNQVEIVHRLLNGLITKSSERLK